MKKSVLVIIASSLLLATNFSNAAPIDSNTLFYCKSNKGKHILLQQDQSAITYSYGKNLQQPEIVLRKAINEVDIERGSYAGGGSSTIATLGNGNYEYTIEYGEARGDYNSDGTRGFAPFGNVTASHKGKVVANVDCNSKSIYIKQ